MKLLNRFAAALGISSSSSNAALWLQLNKTLGVRTWAESTCSCSGLKASPVGSPGRRNPMSVSSPRGAQVSQTQEPGFQDEEVPRRVALPVQPVPWRVLMNRGSFKDFTDAAF
jgi:hypothetical protein